MVLHHDPFQYRKIYLYSYLDGVIASQIAYVLIQLLVLQEAGCDLFQESVPHHWKLLHCMPPNERNSQVRFCSIRSHARGIFWQECESSGHRRLYDAVASSNRP